MAGDCGRPPQEASSSSPCFLPPLLLAFSGEVRARTSASAAAALRTGDGDREGCVLNVAVALTASWRGRAAGGEGEGEGLLLLLGDDGNSTFFDAAAPTKDRTSSARRPRADRSAEMFPTPSR
jgi:hypothetical protein